MTKAQWVLFAAALGFATVLPITAQTYVAPGGQDRPAPWESVDIYSRDGQFLGCYGGIGSTCSKFSADSIENPFGKGNQFQSDSLRNRFGKHGSVFSNESWTNPFATEPPAVIQKDRIRLDYGFKGDLTANDFNPYSLRYWDRELDTSIKLELTESDPFDWE